MELPIQNLKFSLQGQAPLEEHLMPSRCDLATTI